MSSRIIRTILIAAISYSGQAFSKECIVELERPYQAGTKINCDYLTTIPKLDIQTKCQRDNMIGAPPFCFSQSIEETFNTDLKNLNDKQTFAKGFSCSSRAEGLEKCIEYQQIAYNWLKSNWSSFSANSKKECYEKMLSGFNEDYKWTVSCFVQQRIFGVENQEFNDAVKSKKFNY